MKYWRLYTILAVIGVSWLFTIFCEERIKGNAFKQAEALSKEKGIINFGATGAGISGLTKEIAQSPEIKVNVDVEADSIPNFTFQNLEQTPYPYEDKQFDVAFCSHILEHLENWEEAFAEWRRVADNTIIVLPIPYLHGWFSPMHRQHFTNKDISKMRQYPNVFVYC